MEKETLSEEALKEKEKEAFKEKVRKEYEPKIRKYYAQIWRDFYIEIIEDLRKSHDKHEKGEISKEAFEVQAKLYEEMLGIAEAAEYKVLHGPRREFSRLINLRKEKGLTQAEAAVKAGMSLAWYALLEQGFEEKISKKFKQKVCDMLDVPYEKLFFNVITFWGKKTPEEMKKLFEEEELERRKIEPWDREINPR